MTTTPANPGKIFRLQELTADGTTRIWAEGPAETTLTAYRDLADQLTGQVSIIEICPLTNQPLTGSDPF